MIDYLRGMIRHVEPDCIVLDVNGVGYRVFCVNPYAFDRSAEEEKTVYIHHHVREDAILLYGFASREEQSLFRRLIEVSGIGPRVALGIMSGGRPEALIAAIQMEDYGYLTKLPGVGKKTAQRIVLDLKDKLGPADAVSDAAAFAVATGGVKAGNPGSGAWTEAKEALAALGFTESELASVWPQLKTELKEDASEDAVMKTALKLLYRG